MTHSFKLSRRIARLRAPTMAATVMLFGACDNGTPLDPETTTPTVAAPSGTESAPLEGPSFASKFAGGIPMGIFAMPTSAFGSRYNGAVRNIYPQYLLRELSGIKARGGKVVLMMAGNQRMYRDASGHFSLAKWQQRVARFRGVNFNSYIQDGTVIGHYLIDEPNDPNNWNGRTISPATVEAMAKYSKQLWPSMPTIVRTYPEYLAKWSGNYRYLDAAWAQYVYRFGDVDRFIDKNITLARKKGLGLVVGLNVLKGGPNKRKMTPTQVKTWGSALLSSSYPCAFISWTYNSTYLSSRSMQSAMSHLRNKAENRSAKSCRG
jgi:hypothetical protein